MMREWRERERERERGRQGAYGRMRDERVGRERGKEERGVRKREG